MSDNEYLVTVRQIGEQPPIATQIMFEGEVVWSTIIDYEAKNNTTNMEANNVRTTPMNPFDKVENGTIDNKLSYPFEDEFKKGITNSDDVQYKDISFNDTTVLNQINPLASKRPTTSKDLMVKNPMLSKPPRDVPMRKSLIPQNDDSVIKGRPNWRGGMKSRRLATRKNKKKTKTMRRKRRNL
jgi:hypothetical protein